MHRDDEDALVGLVDEDRAHSLFSTFVHDQNLAGIYSKVGHLQTLNAKQMPM